MQSTNNPPLPLPNPTISIQERAGAIENIKKFLIENLPADQISSPQRAHELAARFESHVAHSTQTKEQYHGLIAEKLRMIKGKMDVNFGSSSSTNNNNNINANNMVSAGPINANMMNNNNTNISNSPFIPNMNSITPLLLSPHEISQMSSRLHQLRTQIPQIDKLISMHPRESIKKLIDCRNVLVNQIDLGLQKNIFFINFVQLNVLIEQIQKYSNILIAKLKEANSAAVSMNNGAGNSVNGSSNTGNNNIVSSTGSNVNINPQHQINTNFINTSSSSSNINNTNTQSQSRSTSQSSSSSNSPTSHLTSASFKFAPTSSGSSTNLSIKPLTTKQVPSSNVNNKTKLDLYEKQLRTMLSTPETHEIKNDGNDKNGEYSFYYKYLSNLSTNSRILCKKRLNQRNLLLKAELKCLKDQGYRIHFEENDEGFCSVLIGVGGFSSTTAMTTDGTTYGQFKYFFRIPPMYPFERLLYRIEDEEKHITTLPQQFEPKTFPITFTCILKNHLLFLKEQLQN